MTLLEELVLQGYCLDSIEKKNRMKESFYLLEKIGLLEKEDNHLIAVEEMRDGHKRKITDLQELLLAIREFRHKRDYYSNANRFLYAILSVQGKFDEFQELLPHTIDMLYSLCHLHFQFFPFFELPKEKKDARELASFVLPYEIALRHVSAKDFYTRVKARIEGYMILSLYYSEGMLARNLNYTNYNRVDDLLVPLLFGNDSEKPLMETIIREVYQNAEDIVHSENDEFISMIYPQSLSRIFGEEKEYHYMIFPEVSMIYACVLMGEEDITPLFDLSLSFLKKYTLKVYHDYQKLMKNNT